MTLVASGQISIGDIRTELGDTGSLSMSEAIALINSCASPKPNASTPHDVSEWYSYNHSTPVYTVCDCWDQFCDGGFWADSSGPYKCKDHPSLGSYADDGISVYRAGASYYSSCTFDVSTPNAVGNDC